MANKIPINNSNAVTDYIKTLEPNLAAATEKLRKIILNANIQIGEHIKWNAPAFFYKGKMSSPDVNKFSRDIVVIHLKNGYPLLIFLSGDKIVNNISMLQGNYSDGRRMVAFNDFHQITPASKNLELIISEWIAICETEGTS